MVTDINRYRRALTVDRINDVLWDLRASRHMNDHWMMWAFPHKCKDSVSDPMEEYYGIKDQEEVVCFLEDYDLSDYYQEALFTMKDRMNKQRNFILSDFFDSQYEHFCSHITIFYEVSATYMDHRDVLFHFIEFFFNQIRRR